MSKSSSPVINSKGASVRSEKNIVPLITTAMSSSRTSSVSSSISLYNPGSTSAQFIAGSELPLSRSIAYGPLNTIFPISTSSSSPSGLNFIFSTPIRASSITTESILFTEALFKVAGGVEDLKISLTPVRPSRSSSLQEFNSIKLAAKINPKEYLSVLIIK
ncbi:MAG: hypothetical protein GX126_13120 [Bacteroidales bacterium]|nr:hypothetical protein [Bacteroidales bacterium]